MNGDKKKRQKSSKSVLLGQAVEHHWFGASTFGEVR